MNPDTSAPSLENPMRPGDRVWSLVTRRGRPGLTRWTVEASAHHCFRVARRKSGRVMRRTLDARELFGMPFYRNLETAHAALAAARANSPTARPAAAWNHPALTFSE